MARKNDDDAFINNDMLWRVHKALDGDLFECEVWDKLFSADDISTEEKIYLSKLYTQTKRSSMIDKAVMLAAIVEDDPALAMRFIAEKLLRKSGGSKSEDS